MQSERKLETVKESLIALLDTLNEKDRISIIAFDDNAECIT